MSSKFKLVQFSCLVHKTWVLRNNIRRAFCEVTASSDLAPGERYLVEGTFTCSEGDTINVTGKLVFDHERMNYRIELIKLEGRIEFTESEDGFVFFLTKNIDGIGEKTARELINRFGMERLVSILDTCSNEIMNVPKIGPKTAKKIFESWSKHREGHNVWQFMYEIGIKDNRTIKRIVSAFSPNTIRTIQNSPYKLLNVGVPFTKVDAIAKAMGVKEDSPQRIAAGISYTLKNIRSGDTCVEKSVLYGMVSATLRLPTLDEKRFYSVLYKLNEMERVVIENGYVFSSRMYYDETFVGTRIVDLQTMCSPITTPDKVNDFIKVYEKQNNIKFTDAQKIAIVRASQEGVLIITGGPGTGKTTTIGAILEMFNSFGISVKQASPTGRSARRMEESTGIPAETIHRMLRPVVMKEGFVSFEYNKDNPLEADAFIIDEISMVDINLMARLLEAIPLGSRLILIGDPDQLPSIGPGNVLKDLLDSNQVPTVQLTRNFRQSDEGYIIENAFRINTGNTELLSGKAGDDFIIVKDASMDILKRVVFDWIPKHYDVDPMEIKIATPYRKKQFEISVYNINRVMQDALNPLKRPENEIEYFSRRFRLGDPVIQLKNDYMRGVFNGDIGTIVSLEMDEREPVIVVRFMDNHDITYVGSDINDIEVAYSMTIHKMQGSEFDVVVIVLPHGRRNEGLLKRNLIYTAVTRARKLCVLMSRPETLEKAIMDISIRERRTFLKDRLRRYATDLKKKKKKVAL